MLAMFAIFATLALHTFGRSDGRQMRIDHAGQVELSVKPDKNNSFTPYYNMYGTD